MFRVHIRSTVPSLALHKLKEIKMQAVIDKANLLENRSTHAFHIAQPLDLNSNLLKAPAEGAAIGCQNSCSQYSPETPSEVHTSLSSFPWDRSFLNVLGHHCITSAVRDCQNTECLRKRARVDETLPNSGFFGGDWDSFRKWAIVAICCLRYQEETSDLETAKITTKGNNEKSTQSLCSILYKCVQLLESWKVKHLGFEGILRGKRKDHKVNLFGVCEVIFWISQAIKKTSSWNSSSLPNWDVAFIPQHIVIPTVLQTAVYVSHQGYCPTRLWNLIKASDRQEVDLPAIAYFARRLHRDLGYKHSNCTEDYCPFNDDNSTLVEQLHKCEQGPCKEVVFLPTEVEQAVTQDLPAVWSLKQPSAVDCWQGKYIAISHVWADGTGVGLKRPGNVNSCLWDYFANVAERLGCQGIWWDTICMPITRDSRQKVISNMHENYERAEYTVVHDTSLAEFEWRDDGTPCIALALSPWFTRGWTALELYLSKKVVVLFKDPDRSSSKPLLKDLDLEILAQDIAFAHPGHWLVSCIIQRLRCQKRNEALDIQGLLAILQPRTTSWARDRMIIAGLIVRPPAFNSTDPPKLITRKFFTRSDGSRPQPYSMAVLHKQIREHGHGAQRRYTIYDLIGLRSQSGSS